MIDPKDIRATRTGIKGTFSKLFSSNKIESLLVIKILSESKLAGSIIRSLNNLPYNILVHEKALDF